MKQFIKRNKIASGVIVVCLIGVGVSAWGWWHYIYSNPERVFNRMLTNSLSTPSVTKKVAQAGGGSAGEVTSLRVNPTAILDSVATAEGSERELIATPRTSYIRFTDIDPQKLGLSDSQDLSGVLGVWGESSTADASAFGVAGYNQSLFGIVPVGRLTVADKKALLTQIKQDSVYNVDYSTVKRELLDGRPTYTYAVSIKPRAFISMVKSFSADLGMDDFKNYDPSSYPEDPAIEVTMRIDVWSGQLTSIAYGQGQADEVYSGHGAATVITEPAQAIPASELQTRLQQIR